MLDMNVVEPKPAMPKVKSLRFNLTASQESLHSLASVDNIDSAYPVLDTLEDVWDAIELCHEYDVPYDGLDSLDDFVERLKLHFAKQFVTESYRTKVRMFNTLTPHVSISSFKP